MRLIACAMIAVTCLAACENKGLRQVTSRGDGPDEFIVVPSKPLQEPESFTALPQPTPGGFNRTDQRPLEDSAVALGGQRTSPNAPIPGADGALVNHASRFGRDANIRATLAAADAEFRKRQSRLTQIRIVPEDVYNQAYRREALDAGKTARTFQNAGIPTPTAPPVSTRRRRR
ncbi:hypothetical protein GCM10007385_06180 [Tateyamaria omphalii]|uniref:DUF3035 domain-containing protein n=1 Tax=Tateyamaria omphalii TaxID=299262 RepID=UPI001675944F|nr:DUF3035 domain-containing protein [Tateyamaria omphalii]GGX41400.1 hypothetical protein GCM10007385_06180 [Tateyamaria omphalii]